MPRIATKKLIEGRHIYKTGPDGERQFMTSEEIDTERLNAKRDIDSICNSADVSAVAPREGKHFRGAHFRGALCRERRKSLRLPSFGISSRTCTCKQASLDWVPWARTWRAIFIGAGLLTGVWNRSPEKAKAPRRRIESPCLCEPDRACGQLRGGGDLRIRGQGFARSGCRHGAGLSPNMIIMDCSTVNMGHGARFVCANECNWASAFSTVR